MTWFTITISKEIIGKAGTSWIRGSTNASPTTQGKKKKAYSRKPSSEGIANWTRKLEKRKTSTQKSKIANQKNNNNKVRKNNWEEKWMKSFLQG